jgi:hypothetical protein
VKEEDASEKRRKDLDEEANTCICCAEPLIAQYSDQDFKEFKPLRECKCVIHNECLKDYLQTELDKGNIEIKCMNHLNKQSPNCAKPI